MGKKNDLLSIVVSNCEGTKVSGVVIVEKGLTWYSRLNRGYGLYSTHYE